MAATALKEFTLEEVAQASTSLCFPPTSSDRPQHNTPDDLVCVSAPNPFVWLTFLLVGCG